MVNTTQILLTIIAVLICISITLTDDEIVYKIHADNSTEETMYSYHRPVNLDYFIMDCVSNSMGRNIDCSDIVEVDLDIKTLYEGWIYAYKDGDDYVSHRLVKCLDVNCTQAVFVGDNNKIGEIVNKSQVYGRVISVEYR